MKTVKIYSSKDSTWTNAAGDAVPKKFVPKSDQAKEALAGKIHRAALNAEIVLNTLYSLMSTAFAEIKALMKAEYELKNTKPTKQGKGGLTWYNFDRSLKIEADMNDIVKWDGALMTESLALLNAYISSNLTEANVLIAGLVKSAFANSKGMIDTGKVFQIVKHKKDIKDKRFQKACELIEQASSIDKTKLYMRVWEKTESGEYRNINLNFSAI